MIELFKDFLWDRTTAKKVWRALFASAGGLLISRTIPELEPYAAWGAACMAVAGWISVGEKNPPAPPPEP